MNELLKIDTSNAERITVSARELHKALEVNTDFNHWFTRMCEYGFEDGKDFATFLSESTGGRPSQDAHYICNQLKSDKIGINTTNLAQKKPTIKDGEW